VPFLSLVHLRELRCAQCGDRLAEAGARSFIVDDDGSPHSFASDDQPEGVAVAIVCPNGHATTLLVPSEIAAEEALITPDDAPIGLDAVLLRNN
jgi:hypothetical protein